MQILAFQL